jgi:selenocysteine lyase/cysteine desulfurase
MDSFATLRAAFDPVPGYLDAATMGLPPRVAVQAMRDALDDWQAGRAKAPSYDNAVTAARYAYARLVNVDVTRVAVGAQVSILTGLVAANLPSGSEVLTVDGDFASVVFPFLVHADRGITVRQVPLETLPGEIRSRTALVAFSLVQSADGRVADAPAIANAAAAVGARTLCDVTQAAGWLPVRAGDFDVTVCGAYKWLSCPRGTAFLTVGAQYQDELRPLHAGWYAGESVWDSVYGPDMTLAGDARRFDVSPGWLAWVGTAPALQLFASADPVAVLRHDTELADAFRAGLELPLAGRAIVSLPDPDGDLRRRLMLGGCAVAGRAGRVRIAFHVWNDHDDVDRALKALLQ